MLVSRAGLTAGTSVLITGIGGGVALAALAICRHFGCTTIVTGNCGAGPVDVGKYYDEIDRLGVGVNVAHLLPQGGLRREVVGRERRKASSEELARMKELAARAMKDGAWGMSTGLIYVPSSYADIDELAAVAGVIDRLPRIAGNVHLARSGETVPSRGSRTPRSSSSHRK